MAIRFWLGRGVWRLLERLLNKYVISRMFLSRDTEVILMIRALATRRGSAGAVIVIIVVAWLVVAFRRIRDSSHGSRSRDSAVPAPARRGSTYPLAIVRTLQQTKSGSSLHLVLLQIINKKRTVTRNFYLAKTACLIHYIYVLLIKPPHLSHDRRR